MTVAADPRLRALAAAHPYPLVFATISGAHLYGFPSADSDYDLRGAHLLPLEAIVGLERGPDTIERMGVEAGLDLDLVTHDLGKFVRLMMKPNGYVLEQLHSPLVVATSPAHAELRRLAHGCVTRGHSRHYLGFAATQWQLFTAQTPPRRKPLLYVYRVLLTGIHLMRTGEVEANLVRLNEAAQLRHVAELIAQKTGGHESATIASADAAFHEREYLRLRAALAGEASASKLPEVPSTRRELHELLVGLRCR